MSRRYFRTCRMLISYFLQEQSVNGSIAVFQRGRLLGPQVLSDLRRLQDETLHGELSGIHPEAERELH